MPALPKLSKVTRHYLRDFSFRLAVFLFVAVLFLLSPEWLDFTAENPKFVPLLLLWVAVAGSMVAQLNPNSLLTTGCLKQYPTRYDPADHYNPEDLRQAIKVQNRGALKVAVVWLAVNLCFGILYHRGVLSVPVLVLLCALCYLCLLYTSRCV